MPAFLVSVPVPVSPRNGRFSKPLQGAGAGSGALGRHYAKKRAAVPTATQVICALEQFGTTGSFSTTGSAPPAISAASVGLSFPSCTLIDSQGVELDTGTLQNCVVFLYSRFFKYSTTSSQRRNDLIAGFETNHDELEQLGYQVYGLSYDKTGIDSALPYTLLYDAGVPPTRMTNLITMLACHKEPNLIHRSYFILGADGVILDKCVKIGPVSCVKRVMQFCRSNAVVPSPALTPASMSEQELTHERERGLELQLPPPEEHSTAQLSMESILHRVTVGIQQVLGRYYAWVSQVLNLPPTQAERTQLLQQMNIILQMLRELDADQQREHGQLLNEQLLKVKQQLDIDSS